MDNNKIKSKNYAIKKIISNEFLKKLIKDMPSSPKSKMDDDEKNKVKINTEELNKIKRYAPWNLKESFC
tara:strand:+ start:170 stop:376 length:207 start_codon:yes stop_codon:yes gene_type:complete